MNGPTPYWNRAFERVQSVVVDDVDTRRFPRTLNEAFPNTSAYGNAIEGPAPHGDEIQEPRPLLSPLGEALCWIASFALLALAFSMPWWLEPLKTFVRSLHA